MKKNVLIVVLLVVAVILVTLVLPVEKSVETRKEKLVNKLAKITTSRVDSTGVCMIKEYGFCGCGDTIKISTVFNEDDFGFSVGDCVSIPGYEEMFMVVGVNNEYDLYFLREGEDGIRPYDQGYRKAEFQADSIKLLL